MIPICIVFTHLNKHLCILYIWYFGHYKFWASGLGKYSVWGGPQAPVFSLGNGNLWVSASKPPMWMSWSSPTEAENRCSFSLPWWLPRFQEREERVSKGSGCLLFFPPSVTIVSRFLGYQWPRKGHWASAGFWWSSLKREMSARTLSLLKEHSFWEVAKEWGWGGDCWVCLCEVGI